MNIRKPHLLVVGILLALPAACAKEGPAPQPEEQVAAQPHKQPAQQPVAAETAKTAEPADIAAAPEAVNAATVDVSTARDTAPRAVPEPAHRWATPPDTGLAVAKPSDVEPVVATADVRTQPEIVASPKDVVVGAAPDVAAEVPADVQSPPDTVEQPGDATVGDGAAKPPLVDAERSLKVYEEATKFIKEGKLESATQLLEEWLRATPMDLVNRKNLIHIYMQLKKYEQAELHLKFMAQQLEGEAEWWAHLGRVQNQLAKYAQAVESLEKAQELKPSDAALALDLARVYITRDQLEQARMVLQGALKLEDKQAEIMQELAAVLVELGEFNQAIQRYRKLQRVQPTYATALTMATIAMKYERCDDVVDALAGWKKEYADEKPVMLLGLCAMKEQEDEKAEKLFKAGLDFNDKCYDCALMLGDIYFVRSDWAQAITFYGKAAPLSPRDYRAFVQLGKALANSGMHIEATRALAAANERKPSDPDIVHMLGLELIKAGNKGDAWKVWGELEELDAAKAKELRKLLLK